MKELYNSRITIYQKPQDKLTEANQIVNNHANSVFLHCSILNNIRALITLSLFIYNYLWHIPIYIYIYCIRPKSNGIDWREFKLDYFNVAVQDFNH